LALLAPGAEGRPPVPPLGSAPLPFTFAPAALGAIRGEMRVSCPPPAGSGASAPLVWVFPFTATGEAPPGAGTIVLRADAKKAAGTWAEAHTLLTLPAPIAPLAAAKKARKTLDLPTLLKLYKAVPHAPCRVVEGAGGVAVPIDPKGKDWADFAAAIKPTVAIVVVEDRLGAINQARLAISYLRRRYDGPIGVWLNAIKKPSKEVAAANRAGLAESWIPLLGESGKGEKSARFHFLPR
jgi:dethiobiotin synthetase